MKRWYGGFPHYNTNLQAAAFLPQIRQLIFEGRNKEAQDLCKKAILLPTRRMECLIRRQEICSFCFPVSMGISDALVSGEWTKDDHYMSTWYYKYDLPTEAGKSYYCTENKACEGLSCFFID